MPTVCIWCASTSLRSRFFVGYKDKIGNYKMKVVIPSSYPRRKKRFFRPPKASNGPMTKPFELGGLQMILSENPMSNSSGVTHIDHTSKSKFCFFQKTELWPAGVVHMCTPRTIWYWGFGKYHLKSSQLKRFGHSIITSFAGSKKPFFFGLG